MADLDAAIRTALDDFCTTDWCAEKGRAAIEGVLKLHPAAYPGDVEYEWRNEPAYDKAGKVIGYVPVNSGPVPPYWCQQCDDMQPCPTKRAIATGLGIEVQD